MSRRAWSVALPLALAAWILVAVIFLAGFLVGRASASRPAAQGIARLVSLGRTDPALLTGSPSQAVRRRPLAVVRSTPAPSPSPTGTRPAATAKPKAATPLRHHASGVATWFRSPVGVSAAGPELRRAIGPHWRGTVVRVCYAGICTTTVLGDWMRADRLIDLDAAVFRRLAPLSLGVLRVTVSW